MESVMTPDPHLPLQRLDDIPAAPAWFTQSLNVPHELFKVTMSDGRRLDARAWGTRGRPGLVMLHGSAAHLGWWAFLAPFFADRFRVTTYSLGGMGESEWCAEYSLGRYAEEMWAVADASGATAHMMPPTFVAHSMGGLPVIHASARLDRPMRAAILVDVGLPGINDIPLPPYAGHRFYPSAEAALARFRLAPPQKCDNRWIAEYLGRGAIRKITDAVGNSGWTWRFDPKLWGGVAMESIWEELAMVRCPVALIRGANSRLTAGEMIGRMLAVLPARSPSVSIAGADHHVMIDQPLALVAAIDALLAGWIAGFEGES